MSALVQVVIGLFQKPTIFIHGSEKRQQGRVGRAIARRRARGRPRVGGRHVVMGGPAGRGSRGRTHAVAVGGCCRPRR
jgi:hypothetical protein